MTANQLPDEFTTEELAEKFNVADEDLSPEDLHFQLAIAVVETDTLMGDDPAKYNAMQALARALKMVDDLEGKQTKITLDGFEMTVERTER